jgi:ATP-dependent Clp protease ATP-binding subunit ClpA
MNGYNFTDRVRKVLQMSREEAARRGHKEVDSGHMLLAVISEGEGIGAQVVKRLGVDVIAIRNEIEDAMKRRAKGKVTGHDLPFAGTAKRVLELAMSEAHELRHMYVGTEHLLLGLIREGKGIAAEALTSAGVTLEAARAATLRLLADEMPAGDLTLSASPDPGGKKLRHTIALRRAEILATMSDLAGSLVNDPTPSVQRKGRALGALVTELESLSKAESELGQGE